MGCQLDRQSIQRALTGQFPSFHYKKHTVRASGAKENLSVVIHSNVFETNPHHSNSDHSQSKGTKYCENNLVSIKQGVRSCAQYDWKKKKNGRVKVMVGQTWTPEVTKAHSLTIPTRPRTLRIALIRYPASQLQMKNCKCQANKQGGGKVEY